MSKSVLDAGIPVLTEIIQAPHTDAPTEPVPPPQTETHPHQVEASAHPGVVNQVDIDGWLNEEWNRLERKIGGRILHQVMERIESDIELRVRNSLADALQVAVETLAVDIKQNLQHTLQEAIFQAVKDEISRMQTAKI
jgi:hypothetical protein